MWACRPWALGQKRGLDDYFIPIKVLLLWGKILPTTFFIVFVTLHSINII